MFRKEAEKHWAYIESLLIAAGIDYDLTLHKHLYVEAMVHGFKHASTDIRGQITLDKPQSMGYMYRHEVKVYGGK